jgi:CRP-like cAMP-binding protein
MPLIPNTAALQRIAALPLATYQAGETVLAAGTKTGRLLILRKGAVTIEKEGTEIAKVTKPGAVFGELSALLNQPHTARCEELLDRGGMVMQTEADLETLCHEFTSALTEILAETAVGPARRGRVARAHAAVKKHSEYNEHAFCVAVETAFTQWETLQNAGHQHRPLCDL